MENAYSLIKPGTMLVVDFDGTLVDSEPLHARAYADLLKEEGIEFDPTSFSDFLGKKAPEILTLLTQQYNVHWDEEVLKKREQIFVELFESQDPSPVDAVISLIQDANKKQIPIFILSSQYEHIIQQFIERWDLGALFQDVLTTHTDVENKERGLEYILSLFPDANAHNIVIVEDSPAVLTMAHTMEAKTIAIVHELNRSTVPNIPADAYINIS